MFQSALFSQKKTKEELSGLRPNLVLISYKKNQIGKEVAEAQN